MVLVKPLPLNEAQKIIGSQLRPISFNRVMIYHVDGTQPRYGSQLRRNS